MNLLSFSVYRDYSYSLRPCLQGTKKVTLALARGLPYLPTENCEIRAKLLFGLCFLQKRKCCHVDAHARWKSKRLLAVVMITSLPLWRSVRPGETTAFRVRLSRLQARIMLKTCSLECQKVSKNCQISKKLLSKFEKVAI